jgi:hypothetical protein
LKIVMRFYEPALFDDASFVHKLAVSIVNSWMSYLEGTVSSICGSCD